MAGGGATHDWVQVYLPGAGWLPFDPTNALIGGRNLIRVAVARDPAQAAPLTGSFIGPADAYLGMTVEVQIVVEDGGANRADPDAGRRPYPSNQFSRRRP